MITFLSVHFQQIDSRIEDRVHKQTSAFAVSVFAYAVMSNHVHLVLQVDPGLVATWDDDEVQNRYRSIFTKQPSKNGVVEAVAPEDLKKWRERLGSLSWFRRTLCEPRIRSPAQQPLQRQVQTLPRAHEEERGLPTRKMVARGGSGRLTGLLPIGPDRFVQRPPAG